MNSTVISFQLQLCLILHVDTNTCSIAPPPTQSVRHFKGFVFRTTRGYVDCLFAISMAISKGFNSFFLCSSDPMMISLLHPTPSQNSSIRIFLEPVLLIRFPSFILSEKKKWLSSFGASWSCLFTLVLQCPSHKTECVSFRGKWQSAPNLLSQQHFLLAYFHHIFPLSSPEGRNLMHIPFLSSFVFLRQPCVRISDKPQCLTSVGALKTLSNFPMWF